MFYSKACRRWSSHFNGKIHCFKICVCVLMHNVKFLNTISKSQNKNTSIDANSWGLKMFLLCGNYFYVFLFKIFSKQNKKAVPFETFFWFESFLNVLIQSSFPWNTLFLKKWCFSTKENALLENVTCQHGTIDKNI